MAIKKQPEEKFNFELKKIRAHSLNLSQNQFYNIFGIQPSQRYADDANYFNRYDIPIVLENSRKVLVEIKDKDSGKVVETVERVELTYNPLSNMADCQVLKSNPENPEIEVWVATGLTTFQQSRLVNHKAYQRVKSRVVQFALIEAFHAMEKTDAEAGGNQ